MDWSITPDTCGECKVCADVRVSRGAKINVVATGGGGFVPQRLIYIQ